jgi:hypothetical protein
MEPKFYQNHRFHLVKLCLTLNNFWFGLPLDETGIIYKKLMINMPPQHGKTRTLVNFADWVLGLDETQRFIVASYNDSSAKDFSDYARDNIKRKKNEPMDIDYGDIFPHRKLNPKRDEKRKWAFLGQHFNLLAAGIGGTVTGKGGSIKIADDLIKGAKEAFSENYLNEAWNFVTNTLGS